MRKTLTCELLTLLTQNFHLARACLEKGAWYVGMANTQEHAVAFKTALSERVLQLLPDPSSSFFVAESVQALRPNQPIPNNLPNLRVPKAKGVTGPPPAKRGGDQLGGVNPPPPKKAKAAVKARGQYERE